MFAKRVSAVALQAQKDNAHTQGRSGHAFNVWTGLDSVHY